MLYSVLKYYSYNYPPNDEELEGCLSISKKSKCVVLLYYTSANLTNNADVLHVFIHPDDTLNTIKLRMFAGYKLS